MALLELTNNISRAFENKNCVIGIFLDLSKAFDCVDHQILIKKMEHYGIRGTVLDWFSSYLSNRLQYVYMNDTSSIMQNINIGVPQGSVLGPLLFLLYINDIQFVSKIFHAIIYADDTNLFLSGEKIDFLCNTANSELVKFSEWFASNKLKINVTKTCCMLFKPKNKQINFSDIKLFIDNCCIPLVHSTHFLGVVIDDKLTWKKSY